MATMMKLMWILLIFSLFNVSSGEITYHIVSSENDQCFGEFCLTLSKFAATAVPYLQSDTTIILQMQSGSHNLDLDLSISQISRFYMFSQSSSSRVKVSCKNFARIAFQYSDHVNISGVDFIGCAKNRIRSVKQFILMDSSFSGQGNVSGTALEVTESSAVVIGIEFYFNHGSKMLHSVKCKSSTDYRWRHDHTKRVHVTIGGAIVSKRSRISILQCRFKGNRADVGGAIFCQYRSHIIIRDSTFERNRATSLDQYKLGICLGGGGVMHVESDSSVNIQNSHFIQNSAHYFGGAINTLHSYNAAIIINNSTFIDNSAKYGGVLTVFGTYSTRITISDSEFRDNSAKRDGGVIGLLSNIYFWSAYAIKMTITRSNFIGNKARDHGGVMAISNTENSIVTITKSEFINNGAQKGGGVLTARQNDRINITINASVFNCNKANNGGGLMFYHNHRYIDLAIYKTQFQGNIAQVKGGSLFIEGQNLRIRINGSTFSDSMADSGGAMFLCRGEIVIANSTFTNCSATSDGGGLHLIASDVCVVGTKFVASRATKNGGTICSQSGTILINGSFFTNSFATCGGALYTQQTYTTINDTEFRGSRAEYSGGTMYLNGENVNITDTMVCDSVAGTDGGAIHSHQSDFFISKSKLFNNRANNEGGVLRIDQGTATVKQTLFKNNMADSGGAMFLYRGEVVVANSTFTNCSATSDGGGLHSNESDVCVVGAKFVASRATKNGGSICSQSGTILINSSSFANSSATCGGALYTQQTYTTINDTEFRGSRAEYSGGTMYLNGENVNITDTMVCDSVAGTDGGAIHSHQSDFFISKSKFFNNRANNEGGVLRIDQGTVTVKQTSFNNNTAHRGAVLWADHATIVSNAVNITGNLANSSIVYHMVSMSNWSSVIFTSNTGSLCAISGSIVILRNIVMSDMQPANRRKKSNQLEEGGAITAFQSMVRFYGLSALTGNKASTGGAINAIEAKVYIHGNVTVIRNRAAQNGGGIYLRQSILTCQRNSMLMLKGNKATGKGGGIHAVGSSIKVNGTLVERNCSSLQFIGNDADKGGGLHLEMDAKLYILKSMPYTKNYRIVTFIDNLADHGGAVYVSDNGMCTSVIGQECFFQSLALYNSIPTNSIHQSVHFSNNIAVTSGDSLYGGLLDRCTINPLAETDIVQPGSGSFSFNNSDSVTMKGSDHLHMMSNINDSDIGSPPVRVCFCRNGQPDCAYQPDPIPIRKSHLENISLSLIVLDQINRPIEKARIYNRLSSGDGLCQYHNQTIDGECSVLKVAAFSHKEAEELILFTDGPCKDMSDCQCKVMLEVFCPPCPVGFQLKDGEGCHCGCDSKLKAFIAECSPINQTLMRKKNCWITNISTNSNSSDYQYLIYPHCPLDYCNPAKARVAINLTVPNGADAQCANGRSGLLCGTCQRGRSLSLGSSHCIPCSSHWPAKLAVVVIAAFIAGIFLVALVLVLNLTVAVGSLNGVIFYANIVAANSNTFFPFSKPDFATVFISWFNLEIGFDVCFFDGLDSFWKTLLQLVFPAYIFLLVIIIIVISEVSSKFTKLIGKRNPVATLATLMLISYAKFLHTIIASLSFAVLDYPDGTRRMVWLPDASIDYLQRKHIALFIVAIIILIVGLVYTFLLFSWQWLRRYEHGRLFKWIRYQKLCHFIEPYHAPYAVNHRYWTGLLLLVRVFLYIISAINISGDPRVSLVAIIIVVTSLQFIKGTFAKTLYKNLAVDITETIMFFNLVFFSTATLYTFDTDENQAAVAYTSITITFIVFLAIIAFHVYKYTGLCLLCEKTKAFKVVSAKFDAYYKKRNNDANSISSGSFRENQPRLNPTRSVVEIHDLPSSED